MSDESRAIERARIQYETLNWVVEVCREEKDPAGTLHNMLGIVGEGRPQDFRAILEERRRGLK